MGDQEEKPDIPEWISRTGLAQLDGVMRDMERLFLVSDGCLSWEIIPPYFDVSFH